MPCSIVHAIASLTFTHMPGVRITKAVIKVHGTQCVVHSAWYTVRGTQCMVHSAWYTVYGTQCMVYISCASNDCSEMELGRAQGMYYTMHCTMHCVELGRAQGMYYTMHCTMHCTLHCVELGRAQGMHITQRVLSCTIPCTVPCISHNESCPHALH